MTTTVLDEVAHLTPDQWDALSELRRRLKIGVRPMQRKLPNGWYGAQIESCAQEVRTYLSTVDPRTSKPIITEHGGPATIRELLGWRVRLRPTLYTIPPFEMVVPIMWMAHHQGQPHVRFRLDDRTQRLYLSGKRGGMISAHPLQIVSRATPPAHHQHPARRP